MSFACLPAGLAGGSHEPPRCFVENERQRLARGWLARFRSAIQMAVPEKRLRESAAVVHDEVWILPAPLQREPGTMVPGAEGEVPRTSMQTDSHLRPVGIVSVVVENDRVGRETPVDALGLLRHEPVLLEQRGDAPRVEGANVLPAVEHGTAVGAAHAVGGQVFPVRARDDDAAARPEQAPHLGEQTVASPLKVVKSDTRLWPDGVNHT